MKTFFCGSCRDHNNPQITGNNIQHNCCSLKNQNAQVLTVHCLLQGRICFWTIHCRKFLSSAPPVNNSVTQELRWLQERVFVLKFSFLHEPGGHFQLILHSIHNLHCHYQNIVSERNIVSGNLILTAETWTVKADSFSILGFHQMVCVDNES